jgi:hypothetical protein
MESSLSDLKQLVGISQTHSFEIGQSYLIRTVTFYYTGRIHAITDCDLVLRDAAWIVDTGRFHDALKNGNFLEVEPFLNDVIVPRTGIIDATRWAHELPKEQK